MRNSKRKTKRLEETCQKKVKMTNFEAIMASRRLAKKGKYVKKYICPICGYYHFTHLYKEMRGFDAIRNTRDKTITGGLIM